MSKVTETIDSEAIPSLERAASRLEKLRVTHHELASVIDEILKDIAVATQELRRTHRPVRRRTGSDIDYSVEHKGQDEVLVERRSGGTSPPFRTQRAVFDAIVAAMGSEERPLTYDEIRENAERQLRFPPGEFQIRMVLRFLQRATPPVIRRQRGRYGPSAKTKISMSQFRKLADSAWKASRT